MQQVSWHDWEEDKNKSTTTTMKKNNYTTTNKKWQTRIIMDATQKMTAMTNVDDYDNETDSDNMELGRINLTRKFVVFFPVSIGYHIILKDIFNSLNQHFQNLCFGTDYLHVSTLLCHN